MIAPALAFEGIENFRDFGGYPSGLGGRLAAGRLFRSGHYARATPADVGRLRALGIEVIVDLRRPTERAREPIPPAIDFAELIVNHGGDLPEGPHITFLRETDMSERGIRRYLTSYYAATPFDPRYVELFGKFFAASANVRGAVAVHCAAGKDRTGILVALVQEALGVGAADIREEFLLTNRVMRVAERAASFGPVLERMLGKAPSEAAVRCCLGVDAEHLDAALMAVRERCGSVDSYVRRLPGMDAAALERLRANLLR